MNNNSSTTEPKCTAGPWRRAETVLGKYTEHYLTGIIGPYGNVLCADTLEEAEANGNMLASALELYEACKKAEANLSPLYSGEHVVMVALRTAIAKAEGR